MAWYNTKEAGKILGRPARTIQRWAKSGKIKSRLVPGIGGKQGMILEVYVEESNHNGVNMGDTKPEKQALKNAKISEKLNDATKTGKNDVKSDGNDKKRNDAIDKLLQENKLQGTDRQIRTNDDTSVVIRNPNENNKVTKESRNFNKIAQCTVQPTVQHKKNDVISEKADSEAVSKDLTSLIDIGATVQITGWAKRTIFNKIKRGEIDAKRERKENGGYKTLIELTSLPAEAQEKYLQLKNLKKEDTELTGLTDTQRRYAISMEKIIKAWLLNRKEAKSKGEKYSIADKRFQDDLKNGIILASETKVVMGYSNKTIYKQWKKWEESGRKTSVLAPDAQGNRGRKAIEAKEFYSFARMWILRQPASRAKHMYDKLINAIEKRKGIEAVTSLPSYRTFLDFYNNFKTTQALQIAKMQGKKTLDNLLPYVPRDNDYLPNDVWQYDGYQFKVRVRSPYKYDELIRPHIVYFMDACTELITGYAISFSERSDVIASAWRDAMEKYPAPRILQPDNPAGLYVPELCAAYIEKKEKRKKYLKLRQRAIELTSKGYRGIFFDCGLEDIKFVTPGNSKGKKIEAGHYRIFRKFETLPKFADCFIGVDPMDRPEKLQRTDKAILADKNLYIPEWDYFVEEVHKYIEEYNNTKKPDGYTPLEAFMTIVDLNSRLSEKEVNQYCEWKTILKPRNGYIKLFDSILYEHPAFTVLTNGVVIGYDVRNIEELNVYTLDGRKIGGPAVKAKKGSYIDDAKSVEAIKANRRYRRETLEVQKQILLESDGLKKLTSKQLVKLLSDRELTSETRTLIEDRLNELEKYPEFNVIKRDKKSIQKNKGKISKEVEEAEFEVISDEEFAELQSIAAPEEKKNDELDKFIDELLEQHKNNRTEEEEEDDIFKKLGIK